MISIRNNTKTLNKLHGKIVIANHPSLIDVIILVSLIPKSICVVKQSLFKNAFVKNIINKVYLSNDMQPKDFFATASQILDRGYNIVIFPEGTRTVQDTPIHLHNGFAYLHIFSKHDIQPIHIDNCPQILGKNQSWYDVSTKTSRYTLTELPPIKYKHNNKTLRKQVREISDFIKNTLFNV